MGNQLCCCSIVNNEKIENDLTEKTNYSQVITTRRSLKENSGSSSMSMIINIMLTYNEPLVQIKIKMNAYNDNDDVMAYLRNILIKNKLMVILRVYREYKNRQNNRKCINDSISKRESIESFSSLLPSFKASGAQYIGYSKNRLMNGFGIIHWKKVSNVYSTLTGVFINDSIQGYGRFYNSNAFEYKGFFINNKANGYGLYHHHLNGEQYEGYWENNYQSSIGIETYSDHTQYKGEYASGYKEGIGICVWGNGSIYQGEWKENSMNGYGIYQYKDGHVYSGQFESNLMNGFGDMRWKDNEKVYIGYFKKDKKHGFGIFLINQIKQKAYIGYWKNNIQHGLGKVITPKGSKYGQWILGVNERTYNQDVFYNILYKQGNEMFIKYIKYDYNDLVMFCNEYYNEV